MNRWLRLKRESKGSAAVEFALFLPVLLMLIFGVIELGSAWYARQMLVNASREGARYGILYSSSGITDADVEAYVENILSQAGFPAQAEVVSTGAGGGPGTLVEVQVSSQYRFPVLSSLTSSLGTVNLHAATVMRHE